MGTVISCGLLGIYSNYENRSFLKSMLLNHTKTIAKAGGRKTEEPFLF